MTLSRALDVLAESAPKKLKPKLVTMAGAADSLEVQLASERRDKAELAQRLSEAERRIEALEQRIRFLRRVVVET